MHVISKKRLIEFWTRHPDSRKPLVAWLKIVRTSRYRSWHELKATFPRADRVEGRVVFDIGGNKYRLIAVIHFNRFKVYVRQVLTHGEYDKGGWKHG